MSSEWKYRMLPRPIKGFPNRVAVSFTSDSGSGLAAFRDGDQAREFLTTDQSVQMHEAARRYLEHLGESAKGDALFDVGWTA